MPSKEGINRHYQRRLSFGIAIFALYEPERILAQKVESFQNGATQYILYILIILHYQKSVKWKCEKYFYSRVVRTTVRAPPKVLPVFCPYNIVGGDGGQAPDKNPGESAYAISTTLRCALRSATIRSGGEFQTFLPGTHPPSPKRHFWRTEHRQCLVDEPHREGFPDTRRNPTHHPSPQKTSPTPPAIYTYHPAHTYYAAISF
jgi:hypothetical protein